MRLFVYFVLLFSLSEAKIFTRCRLATEIVKTKMVEKTFLGNWVCLAEKVSNRNTKALVVSPSGKKSYGLYQIPARWCKEGKKGGDCNIACESLLDDDIRDDTACAVNIFEREGFKYWEAWNKRCKNDYHITNEIYKCPDLMTSRSPDRTLDVNSRSEKLRYKRKISRVGMIRSRLHSYHAVKWTREY